MTTSLEQLFDYMNKSRSTMESLEQNNDETYISSFTVLLFTSRQTGVSRKELSTWNKEDLLPYQITLATNDDDSEYLMRTIYWRRYSLIECIWIKILVKLKKYGIQDSMIADLRKVFFQEEDMDSIDNATLTPDDKKILKLRASHFGLYLMHTTKYHIDFSILVSEDGEFGIVDLDSSSFKKIHERFRGKSYVTINVSSLMRSFISSDEVSLDADFYVSILHPKERDIIRQIKQNVFKQVTLTLKNGSIAHYQITKDREANELAVKNIARLLKKEDYISIQCASIDDKVVTFEEKALTSIDFSF